jgi:hypothetical protein
VTSRDADLGWSWTEGSGRPPGGSERPTLDCEKARRFSSSSPASTFGTWLRTVECPPSPPWAAGALVHPLTVRALAFSGKISGLRTWTIPPIIGLGGGGIAITRGTATLSAREGSSGASGACGRGGGLTTQAAWSRGWAWVASDPSRRKSSGSHLHCEAVQAEHHSWPHSSHLRRSCQSW